MLQCHTFLLLQERISAVQVENPQYSGDTSVEFTKRVMILKDKKQFLPSAMELAGRRRFQELYQSVYFSKKMEECEVLSQLRKVFKILGTVRFVKILLYFMFFLMVFLAFSCCNP